MGGFLLSDTISYFIFRLTICMARSRSRTTAAVKIASIWMLVYHGAEVRAYRPGR